MGSILCDSEIVARCRNQGMILPYFSSPVRENEEGKRVISYGPSSYGYDIRCGYLFHVFSDVHSAIVDPKNMNEDSFVPVDVSDRADQSILIPPNSFALTHSLETFKIPRDILVTAVGKSTYARCGIIVNVTPLEPEWGGTLTIEISNTTPLPARVYAGEGILQLIFHTADKLCDISYADKGGKYQNQVGVTGAIV